VPAGIQCIHRIILVGPLECCKYVHEFLTGESRGSLRITGFDPKLRKNLQEKKCMAEILR
jgi:hypothetical protein